MAGNTDFLVFYQELGLRADCSLQDFKLAYRKRVSEIHPDRDPEAATTHGLQRLNGLYASAMEFHRRHGRLPGALPAAAPQRAAVGTPAKEVAFIPAESPKTRRWIFAALILLLVAMASWSWVGAGREEASRAAAVPAAGATLVPAEEAIPESMMDLGATAERVRELNGEPVSGWEQRWEYGPSWVAFRCGLVSDWYSSRLRPLKVATEHPSPSAEWSPPKSCRE